MLFLLQHSGRRDSRTRQGRCSCVESSLGGVGNHKWAHHIHRVLYPSIHPGVRRTCFCPHPSETSSTGLGCFLTLEEEGRGVGYHCWTLVVWAGGVLHCLPTVSFLPEFEIAEDHPRIWLQNRTGESAFQHRVFSEGCSRSAFWMCWAFRL